MCSQALAVSFAGLAVYALSTALSSEALHTWGWRVPFLFGILVGPVGFYIRRRLQESPEFAAYRAAHPKSTAADFRAGLIGARASLVAGFGLTVSATIGFYLTFIYIPLFAVKHLGFSLAHASLPTMLCGLLLTILCPLTGRLSDRWGRKRLLLAAMALYALVMLVGTPGCCRRRDWGAICCCNLRPPSASLSCGVRFRRR